MKKFSKMLRTFIFCNTIMVNLAFANTSASNTSPTYSFCLNRSGVPFNCFINKTIYDENNNQYVAVGYSSEYEPGEALVLTSKNGVNNWQVSHYSATIFPEIKSIVKANNQYFAVGVNGTIEKSLDGSNYQKINIPNGLTSITFLNIVANSQNQIMAIGNDTGNTHQLYSAISNDGGINWQENKLDITNTNGRYIIVLNTIWDPQLSQYVSIANSLDPGQKDPGKHVALISKNGTDWTIYPMDGQNYGGFDGNTLTKYKDKYLAGGISMSSDNKVFANLMWSSDGRVWNSTNDTNITSIHGVINSMATDGNNVVLSIKDYSGDQSTSNLYILKSADGLDNYQIVSHQFLESEKICAYNALWAQNSFLITGMLDAAVPSEYSAFKEQIIYSDSKAENWNSPLTQTRPN